MGKIKFKEWEVAEQNNNPIVCEKELNENGMRFKVCVFPIMTDKETSKKHAALIAASPTMYEALVLLKNRMDLLGNMNKKAKEFLEDAVLVATIAIKKAEGT